MTHNSHATPIDEENKMLTNSRRSIDKVTYAPIRPSDADVESGAILKRTRTLERAAVVRALALTEAEAAELKRRAGNAGREYAFAVDAITALALAPHSKSGREPWTAVAKVSNEHFIAVGRALAVLRKEHKAQLLDTARKLIATYSASVPPAPEHSRPNPPVVRRSVEDLLRGSDAIRPTRRFALTVEAPAADSTPARKAGVRPGLGEAMTWALSAAPDKFQSLTDLASKFRLHDGIVFPLDQVEGVLEEVSASEDEPDWTDELMDGFEEAMKVEPIGRLHLERLDMTPLNIVRGELVHSIALAPAETIQVIHREWSSRTTEFEKVVSEEFEQSTEEGVTENTDLSTATESQSKHSRSLNVDSSASGSYGFASASVTVGYNTSSDDEQAKRDSRNHSVGVTRKASARTRQEHKVTFTVKQEAGVEDESIRTLANSSETEPLRVDYHQMMRKWQVDLYRYGLRLTYDIVVPAPGIDLLAQVDRLRALDASLHAPFDFKLVPAQITSANWVALAAQYGADVEAPPPTGETLFAQRNFPEVSEDDAESGFQTFDFEIPQDYRIRRASFTSFFLPHEEGFFDVMLDPVPPLQRAEGDPPAVEGYNSGLQHLIGARGTVAVVMILHRIRFGYAQATLELEPTPEAMQSWQRRAWLAMRQAALEAWQSAREQAQAERDRLAAEIAKWDALSLRRLEREELMKTVLKWIFGPDFDLMAGSVRRLFDTNGDVAAIEPSRLTEEQWARVMGAGEFIKFLHQAIEWENVLSFPYPYFWDHPKNHYHKRFLNHPDSTYRAFLRAGAARVVLPVRPGFEESFTKLFEKGSFHADLQDHPYLTIAQEIRAYADTRYPGIPSSEGDGSVGPEASEDAERGIRIASWFEYTPVSGLDITVNTPLEDMA